MNVKSKQNCAAAMVSGYNASSRSLTLSVLRSANASEVQYLPQSSDPYWAGNPTNYSTKKCQWDKYYYGSQKLGVMPFPAQGG